MRKLLYFGIGFCVACAFGAYVLDSLWLLIPAASTLAVGFVLLRSFLNNGWQRKLAFALIGLAVGFLWFCLYGQLYLKPARQSDGKKRYPSAVAQDYSYDTGYGTAVRGLVQIEGRSYQCLIYLDEWMDVAPGDTLSGEYHLRYTGSGAQKENYYYSGTGWFLQMYQEDSVEITRGTGDELRHFPTRLRNEILNIVESVFPEDTEGFAKALLLGDRSDMDYEIKTALTLSGIIHVVSVSGLHISILLSLIFMLLGRRRFLTPIVGTAVLLLAAAVTGFSVSVVRSCLMNWLVLLALMLEKEYDPLTAVAFALLVMLGCNPMAITAVGLQLSAASVIGIHLLAEPISEWLGRWGIWADAKRKSFQRLRDSVCAAVGVSAGATVATAPLTAMCFGTVSLNGCLTNLLVLWVINFVFVGIIISVILGAVWLPAGAGLAAVLSTGIQFVLWVAMCFSRFPLAAVYTQSPYIVAWLIFAYIMLTVFVINKHKRRLQLCIWVSLTLAAAIAFSWLEPLTEDFRVTAVDVGQGQCILLQSDGKTYMVDCGGSGDEAAADEAAAALQSQGIFRLDGLILTHYDRDHVGGAEYLLTRIPVENVYLPAGPEREEYMALMRMGGAENIICVDENTFLNWGNTNLSIFSFGAVTSSNESSLCILFQKESCDILITGDQSKLGEMVLLQQNDIPQVDVLVVGHHGAGSSTGEQLLSAIRPSVAVISVGKDNRYGHPTKELLKRLEEFGCQIRRTDLEGTIIIKR